MDKNQGSAPGSETKQTAREAMAEAKQRSAQVAAALAKKFRKRRRRRVAYGAVAASLILVVLGTGAYNVYNALNSAISGVETEAGELPQEYKTAEEEQIQGIVNFLVCGIDYSDETDPTAEDYDPDSFTADGEPIGNTDMIMYVRYDTAANDVSIMQFPRDIFVGEEVDTGGWGKVNSLFKFAEDTENRMAALVEVLYQQFGLPVDFYVTIDMDALKEIIDIKGSIEVYVPIEVNNPEFGDVIYPGWRHFSGEEAEFYLRNRKSTTYNDQGDIMRLQMQQYFYSAIFREFKTLEVENLVMWMGVLLYRAKTDMDVIRLGSLAQHAMQLQGADITFVRPAVGGAFYQSPVRGSQSVLILQEEEYLEILNEYFPREGRPYTAADLDIQTLEIDEMIGISETALRTMGDIMQEEVEYDAGLADEGAAEGD